MAKLRSWAFLAVGLLATGSVSFMACSSDEGVTPEVELDSGTGSETATDDTSTTTEAGGDSSAADGSTDDVTPNTDAPVTTDAPASDAPVTADAGGDTAPVSFMIACGATPCDSRSKDCCVTITGSSCIDKGTACAAGAGATLSCSTRDNCPTGQFCCATTLATNVTAASCKTACAGTEEQLCTENAQCGVGGGARCNQTFGAYKACQ